MSLAAALRLSRRTAPAFAAMGGFWGAFAAYVPVIKAGLGAGDLAFGTAMLVSSAGLVMAMWLAPWADARLGAKSQPAAVAALALATLAPGLAPSLPVFAVSMLVVGLASGLLDVVMNTRVSEAEARTGRSLMNFNHAMFSVAYAASALASGPAREAGVPPAAMFAGVALLSLLATPVMVQAVADPADDADGGGLRRLGAVVVPGGLIVLIAFLAENACEAWSALHIERTLGGGATAGAGGPAMLGLTMAAGRLAGQVAAGRAGETTVILWAAVLSALGAALAAVAATPAVAIAGFAALGLGVSVIAPMALALVGRSVPPAARSRAISRCAVIGFCGFFLGPPMMGALSEAFGLRASFAAVALLLAGILALVAPLVRATGERVAAR